LAKQMRAHACYRALPDILHRLVVVLILGVITGCGWSGNPLPTGILPTTEDEQIESWPESQLDPADAPACSLIADPKSPIHEAMYNDLNQYRIENGLQPLLYSQTLETAAENHVKDLWGRNFFSHINPDGLDPGDRAIRVGFCHSYVGENIAAGQNSTAHVLQAWIDSPTHNANMLEPNYAYVGMGYSVDDYGRKYWGQVFAYDLP